MIGSISKHFIRTAIGSRSAREWAGFTDIECNPERSINCQARSFAAFVALQKRDELDATVARFQNFKTRWELAGL
jgi:hypothetical protein